MENKENTRLGTMYEDGSNFYRVISSNENEILLALCNKLGWTISEITKGEQEDTIVSMGSLELTVCENINNDLIYKKKETSLKEITDKFGYTKVSEEYDDEENLMEVFFNGPEQLLIKHVEDSLSFCRLLPFD